MMQAMVLREKEDLKKWLYALLAMNVLVHVMYMFMVGVPNTFLQSVGRGVGSVSGVIGFHFGLAALIMELAGCGLGSLKAKVLWWGVGASVYGYALFFEGSTSSEPTWNSLILLSGLGLGYIFDLLKAMFRRGFLRGDFPSRLIVYLQLAALVTLLSMATGLALELTKVAFPSTYDYHAYRIDAAFVGLGVWCAQAFDHAWPSLQAATFLVYSILILCFYIVIGLLIREGRLRDLNGWRTLIVPFMLAWFCYAWVPVSGPIYAFFDGRFPHSLPSVSEVAGAKVVLPPFARNGMPSFHLTGAIMVWMLSAGLRNKLAFGFMSILVLGVLWSTLALGEHYVIDLIVAFPFALALGWTLINPAGSLFHSRRIGLGVVLAWGTFLVWMSMLSAAPVWLSVHLGFVQFFSIWSVLLAVFLATFYLRVVWRWKGAEAIIIVVSPNKNIDLSDVEQPYSVPASFPWVLAIFFASGFAGLVYEVVYAKALALTFGSTAVAAYTVLAVYMGGMAAGAGLGGVIAERVRQPLKVYALFEAAIGVYALATPSLFKVIQNIYVHVGVDVPPDSGYLMLVRVGMGALALLFPTALMGATLPLMFKYVNSSGVNGRSVIANLYSSNVVGAACGSLVACYAILPMLGRDRSTFVAAALSLLIALYALDRAKRDERALPAAVATNRQSSGDIAMPGLGISPFVGASALVVLAIGGAITLALEVTSMHVLATIAGSSVYAFGLMLASFLIGLGGGASIGERFASKLSKSQMVLIAQCGLAVSIALTAHLWDSLPGYFGSFGMTPVYLSFGGREFVRAMVCMLAMAPAAFFIGVGYPAAMALASEWVAPKGMAKGVGVASALNTLGNISGVLIAGFWVLPSFGSRLTFLILACLALLLASLFAVVGFLNKDRQGVGGRRGIFAVLVVAYLAVLSFPREWDWNELSSGSNVYFSPQSWGQVVDHAESVEGGITSVTRNGDGILTLLTNGKFQGNNSRGGEMQAQASFALMPLLHTSERKSALVIGYGTGMTTQVLHTQGFENIDVAELSSDLVRLANKYFSTINLGVMESDSVHLHITDGRNYLLTQSRKYDLISIELTSIWFAGAANLYNKDFYELAKTRMTGDGVIQQWVQMHHMSQMDLLYILGSVRSVFRYVWVYYSGGQGIIVASNSDKAIGNGKAGLLLDKSLSSGLYDFDVTSLRSRLMAGPANVDHLIKKFDPTMSRLVSTDDNLYLEYSTPRGNAARGDTVPSNLRLFRDLAH